MGPLSGMRILELAGIGPGPFCGMMLADQGADVIRIDRPGGNQGGAANGHEVLFRNRRTLALNLKHPDGVATLLQMCEQADAVFEGFRPGVAERLGVGPAECMARNPRLVYGRMTGWGQTGPLARVAGHDINYIALTGALHAMGRAGEKPVPPLNLVGDFGGGGMLLAFGMVCALLEAQRTGRGQIVDAAMIDGAAALMAMFYGMKSIGMFDDTRGTHMLDTGAHYYDVYETSDGRFVSIGSIEPPFYALLLEKAGLSPSLFGVQNDPSRWPAQKEALAAVFRSKTCEEWCTLLEGSDVCFAPVLGLEDAPHHPHNVARGTFIEVAGVMQHAPAPRFSGATPALPSAMGPLGEHSIEVLADYGFSTARIDALLASGAVVAV